MVATGGSPLSLLLRLGFLSHSRRTGPPTPHRLMWAKETRTRGRMDGEIDMAPDRIA
jgi:hypothetical protein